MSISFILIDILISLLVLVLGIRRNPRVWAVQIRR